MLKEPIIQENILLSNHTTFRLGGPARYFCAAQNERELIEAVKWAKEKNLPIFVFGGGSNLLVADEGFSGLAIKVKSEKFKVRSLDDQNKIIEVDAGVPLSKIVLETTRDGYSGLEWGFGIPGTLGGAICGNAGRLGQDVSQVVESVTILDENFDKKILSFKECEFAYRESRFKKTGEMILSAVLKFKKAEQEEIEKVLSRAREVVKNSPSWPSAGCAFKNYQIKSENDVLLKNHPELKERARGGKIGVGFLIQQCGLKGTQIGGAKIWENHANYIVNVGKAKADDVKKLIDLVKNKVKERFGILLEEEIRFLGF